MNFIHAGGNSAYMEDILRALGGTAYLRPFLRLVTIAKSESRRVGFFSDFRPSKIVSGTISRKYQLFYCPDLGLNIFPIPFFYMYVL